MANKRDVNQHHQTFESIRKFDADGSEYWLARDLQPLLEYTTWDKFRRVIEKAMEACRQSDHEISDHFSQTVKMVDIDSSAKREIEDFRLSRYACYLIVQNGDPSKPVIANGQTYFAMQTRRRSCATTKPSPGYRKTRSAWRSAMNSPSTTNTLPLRPRMPEWKRRRTAPSFRITVTKVCMAGAGPRTSMPRKG